MLYRSASEVSNFLRLAQLATPGLMVEVEVDAITGPRAPSGSGEDGL